MTTKMTYHHWEQNVLFGKRYYRGVDVGC